MAPRPWVLAMALVETVRSPACAASALIWLSEVIETGPVSCRNVPVSAPPPRVSASAVLPVPSVVIDTCSPASVVTFSVAVAPALPCIDWVDWTLTSPASTAAE